MPMPRSCLSVEASASPMVYSVYLPMQPSTVYSPSSPGGLVAFSESVCERALSCTFALQFYPEYLEFPAAMLFHGSLIFFMHPITRVPFRQHKTSAHVEHPTRQAASTDRAPRSVDAAKRKTPDGSLKTRLRSQALVTPRTGQ